MTTLELIAEHRLVIAPCGDGWVAASDGDYLYSEDGGFCPDPDTRGGRYGYQGYGADITDAVCEALDFGKPDHIDAVAKVEAEVKEWEQIRRRDKWEREMMDRIRVLGWERREEVERILKKGEDPV